MHCRQCFVLKEHQFNKGSGHFSKESPENPMNIRLPMCGMSMPVKSGSRQALWSLHSLSQHGTCSTNGLGIRRPCSTFLLNLHHCNDLPLMNKALRIPCCWSATLKNHYAEEGRDCEIQLLSQRSPKLKSKVVII